MPVVPINTTTNRYILHCDDSIDGILTAVYDGFVLKKQLRDSYEDNISIAIGAYINLDLFSEWIEIKTDVKKAELTAKSIFSQLGPEVYEDCLRVICHFDLNRASILFGFLVRGFSIGPSILNHLSDPYVIRVMEYSRKVANEAHLFRGFVRFIDLSGTLYCRIEPKCNVLPLISDHFEDRFFNENWIIYDAIHKLGSIHQSGKHWFLCSDSSLEIDLNDPKYSDDFASLWQIFFQTIAIKERLNPTCQNNLIPKWYRKNMPEF